MKKTYLKNSNTLQPIIGSAGGGAQQSDAMRVWLWGADNLLPSALSALSRGASIHRRILHDKADYIAGRGFKCDDPMVTRLSECCNSQNQSLRSVVQRLALDKCVFGNALLEVVISDAKIALWHQDVTRMRLAVDTNHVVLSSSWSNPKSSEVKVLPLFPLFEEQPDGTLRTAIHYKDYEPMFENYGVPKYVGALGALAIAHKTEKWNITRIDNAFSLSGVMVLDGAGATEEEAETIAQEAQKRFEGTPGQVMFMVKNDAEADTSKFVPITTSNDADWKNLQQQSTDDIIIAHSWFRTLSGMDYSTGFSSARVQNEYNIALSTLIKTEQQDLLEPIQRLITANTKMDASTLEAVNIPPFDPRQPYMKVWEARKADGMDYAPNAEDQNQYLSQIGSL